MVLIWPTAVLSNGNGTHPGMITYEEISGQTNIDAIAARDFIGNPSTGYKVAFCERDIAIYGSIFLFGLIFSLTGRKLKSIPWYLWVVIGLIPIGIDGVSQLPSLLANILPGWVPQRESTPFLRTLTGGMFGFTLPGTFTLLLKSHYWIPDVYYLKKLH